MHKNRIAAVIAVALVLAFASLNVSAASKTVTFKVEGMDCGGCASSIEKALKATDGVEDAQVSFEKGEAVVKYDDQKVTVERLREVITDTGYKVVSAFRTNAVDSLTANGDSNGKFSVGH